jgi:hypothetical protein
MELMADMVSMAMNEGHAAIANVDGQIFMQPQRSYALRAALP